jgi:hypothetical protein
LSRNHYEDFLDRYGPETADPELSAVLFFEEVLEVDLDPWQEECVRAFGRGEQRISIRACHGPGKTMVAAGCVLLTLTTRFPSKTVATAPSRGQLEDALVAEVKTLFRRLPAPIQLLFNVKATRIELIGAEEECFFAARTARAENPEALQGVHSDAGWVFLLADEASGVPEPIFEASAGSMSGKRVTTMLLSNPTRTSGFFFDTHHKLRDMWFTMQVSAQDSPRVTDDFVEDIRRRYGENSSAYRVRVLGEFPLADLDTVIPYHLADGAMNRDITTDGREPTLWGLDVARFGDDKTVLVKRSKREVRPDILIWEKRDTMETVGRVVAEFRNTPDSEQPSEILVDVIGMGGGVVDRLIELGLPARGINVGEMAGSNDTYLNLRSELWFKVREWLEQRQSKLPKCKGGCPQDCPHELLLSELTAPRYKFSSSGKIQVESKSDMKGRGLHSPDIADALMLTFASEPATMGASDGWGDVGWNQEISRFVDVV